MPENTVVRMKFPYSYVWSWTASILPVKKEDRKFQIFYAEIRYEFHLDEVDGVDEVDEEKKTADLIASENKEMPINSPRPSVVSINSEQNLQTKVEPWQTEKSSGIK